jgi:transcription elongation factor Elf1
MARKLKTRRDCPNCGEVNNVHRRYRISHWECGSCGHETPVKARRTRGQIAVAKCRAKRDAR